MTDISRIPNQAILPMTYSILYQQAVPISDKEASKPPHDVLLTEFINFNYPPAHRFDEVRRKEVA